MSHCCNNQSPDVPDALPILQEAHFDWEGVDCLFADLDELVQIIELRGKDQRGTTIALQDMAIAHRDFVAGNLLAVQVLYRFADNNWSDTILRTDTGARLLRLEDPQQL